MCMCMRLYVLVVMYLSYVMGTQHWAEQPVSVAVNPGEEATLACRVNNMGGDCRWERRSVAGEAGVPVGIYRGKYEWAGRPGVGDCSLRVLQADPEFDSGLWVCQVTASNFRASDTLISNEAKLVVRGPPKSVSLLVSGSPPTSGRLQGRAGQHLEVQCRVEGGNPAPQVAWRLGDVWVEGGPTMEDQEGDTVTSVLRLPLSQAEHGKMLQCEVRHEALKQELSARASLSVMFAPVTSLSPEDSSPSVLEGSSPNVTCLVSSNPPAQVAWVREATGQEVGRQGVLILRQVTRKEAGRYTCTATNSLGSSAPAVLNLDVQYAARVLSIHPGGSITGQYGESLSLQCDGEGSPPPSLSWQQTSPRGVTGRGEGPHLSLANLEYEDQGEYTCLATNSIGQDRSPPVSVAVVGPPRVAITQPGGVHLLEGGDAVLEVEWCGAPFPRQVWRLEGRAGEEVSLTAGLSHGKYEADNARPGEISNCYISTLRIVGADRMDSREYKLSLENEYGEEEHVAKLTVGREYSRETLIGTLVGAGATLVICVIAVICCCRNCCVTQKKVKQDCERTV